MSSNTKGLNVVSFLFFQHFLRGGENAEKMNYILSFCYIHFGIKLLYSDKNKVIDENN